MTGAEAAFSAVASAAVLFTKPAEPGRVKTRLIGRLSKSEAARLHAAFVLDTSASLSRGAFDLLVAWALDGELAAQPELVPAGVPALEQSGETLGERLFSALETTVGRGYRAVAAVGSDHPGLPARRLAEAFALLGDVDVVFGPVPDGGYDLVALRADVLSPRLFEGIAWSTSTVLEESRVRVSELGLRDALLSEGFDVDTPADLEELVARVRQHRLGAECPKTVEVLSSLGLLAEEDSA
ncbi:MAG: TIGR04282 family arsenosugar biosynthesis glycosyltransferase [Acidobacteriota bacterium]